MTHRINKTEYWAVVEDCLKEIYQMKPEQACEIKDKVRAEVEQTSKGKYADLFYHAEPIHVASDLAGETKFQLNKKKRKLYDAILARHDW